MSLFQDSDDEDLMIPLSDRLGLKSKRSLSPKAVTVISSSSSGSTDEIRVVEQKKDKSLTPLRRCVTLNDFSPVTKFKKKNTPIKPVVDIQKESISLSDSLSSCLTLSSASNHSLSLKNTAPAEANALIADPVATVSSSQIYCSSDSVRPSQSSSTSDGRAPAKKISSRDCQALICTEFFTKHFKDEEIRKVFSEFECRFKYDSYAKVKKSVTFVREVVNEYGNQEEKPEDQIVVILQKDELVRMVHKYKLTHSPQKDSDPDDEEVIPIRSDSEEETEEPINDRPDLVSFVATISASHPDKNITLILTGVASYFRAQKKKLDESYNNFMKGKTTKQKSSRRRKSGGVPSISSDDLTEALVDLQIRGPDVLPDGRSVNHYVIERMTDVLALIASITRSVAEAPTKRSQKEMSGMDWFAENDKSASVDLKDMEKDVLRLWRKQLEQFPKVSREVADSIARLYPNARSLIETYDRLDEASGRILLQDIPVGKNMRRIGPEISRKIHLFFTSTDPDLFLGKDV